MLRQKTHDPQGVELTVTVPGSKSVTQRVLMLAAFAPGESELIAPLDCDDSVHLRDALRQLGVGIEEQDDRWLVRGGVLHGSDKPLWCGDAGTTSRFLAPLSLLLKRLALDGSPRLRQRPIAKLVSALRSLGVESKGEKLPLELRRQDSTCTKATIETTESSQFLSGLLMVAPRLPNGLTLEVAPSIAEAVSWPYVELTLALMEEFGASHSIDGDEIHVQPGGYHAHQHQVEGDWSAGAFWLAAAQFCRRQVTISNLSSPSLQGDSAILRLLDDLRGGVHRLDLTDCPDLLPPLAAACSLAAQPTQIVGVAHARTKECDRVAALARGLSQLGVGITEHRDGLDISPVTQLRAPDQPLETRNDHRMAMTFGILSLNQPAITMDAHRCVSKSYPGFWHELERWR